MRYTGRINMGVVRAKSLASVGMDEVLVSFPALRERFEPEPEPEGA